MAATQKGSKPGQKVFLFGPQALSFDTASFTRLHNQIHDVSDNQWVRDVVSTLPKVWDQLVNEVPNLRHINGKQLLEDLNAGLEMGKLSPSLFPLSNIILTPLVVISHLTQYTAFLRAALPNISPTDEIPSSIISSAETLGLCTGVLSAFAVASSSTIAELQQNGPVAVRLAMLVGALVDAEQASPKSDGVATLVSVSWNDSDSLAKLKDVLAKFPDAYFSVLVDEKRYSLTVSKSNAAIVIQKLKLAGIQAKELPLTGRFHWPHHQDDTNKLIRFCDANPEFQFPDIANMAMPSRHDTDGQYLSTGKLHDIALQGILVRQCEWYKSCSIMRASQLAESSSSALGFGSERCLPPSISRKLGSQFTQIADLDLTDSVAAAKLVGQSFTPSLHDLPDERVAVIGMSCHVPGAEDLEEYWKILCAGQSQHKEVPADRFKMETPWRDLDPKRKWYGNFIDNYDTFDHKFFKKSPREMASCDPQHRLVMKLAYQAVEQSGYFGVPDFDKHIGCYIGVGNVDYHRNIACQPANAYTATGILRSFMAGKVSHYFGWTGPSLTIDTACSSSSVAIHRACQDIIHGECTTALAGGVNILAGPEWFQNMAGASFLSTTGQCKPFDAKGDGYCRSEGAGIVFLKKLSAAIADGDQVLGVIAGTKVYQNQNCTAITVPNAISLSGLFSDVVRKARLEPHKITVAEAHGTGTPVGDPAEYDGIRRVLGGSERPDKLQLTSVKGLLGHSEFASGAMSLIKILLMINERQIPPQASFTSISPALNAVPQDNIEIPTSLKAWDSSFRAALINNYGASGSNSSTIVTQAPEMDLSDSQRQSITKSVGKSFPFWLCGLDEKSLKAYAVKLQEYIQNCETNALGKDLSVANLSFQASRQSNRLLPQSIIFSASSTDDLKKKLTAFEQGDKSVGLTQQSPSAKPVILCFGGQISTFVGLDKDIYENVTVFRNHLDQCDAMCRSLGIDSIFPDIFQRSTLGDIVKLQTALFAMQYSCAKTWMDSGVKPAAVVGHSFGELTALCVAGSLSLKDAVTLIAGRARLIRDGWGPESGSMLAMEADLTDVESLLTQVKKESGGESNVSIACYNGPRTFTLAGSAKYIQLTEDLAKANAIPGMKQKKLNVTNAFHSALVDPLKEDLEQLGNKLTLSEPTVRVEHSAEVPTSVKLDHTFVAKHLRNPVFFNHAVQRLAKEYPAAIWLEAGSNSTITNMANRALGSSNSSHLFQAVNLTSDGSFQFLVDTTTKLWKGGLNISFWAHHAKQVSDYAPIILPPYQFEKSRHWVELTPPPQLEKQVVAAPAPVVEEPKTLTTFVGFQDEAKKSVRFRVNQNTDPFKRGVMSNIVAKTATLVPNMLQAEIVVNALKNLKESTDKLQLQAELRGLSFINPMIADPSQLAYLDAVAVDSQNLIWSWKLVAADQSGTITSEYTKGTVVLYPTTDTQIQENYDSLARLSGRKACVRLLNDADADDVLQGRNIYRAFQSVAEYGVEERYITKVVGKDDSSAARVAKKFDKDSNLDPALAESFLLTSTIFVNLMTDAVNQSGKSIYVCDKIARWVRNPKFDVAKPLPETWEVFAVHHDAPDGGYISDIFAFDTRDGTLVEASLGVSHRKVSLDWLRQDSTASTSSTSSAIIPTPTSSQDETQEYPAALSGAAAPTTSPEKVSDEAAANEASEQDRPDIPEKTRDILSNLSGLDPEDFKDHSDLIELGIDSLMAMELVREVEAAFKETLTTDQLMELTDFMSLVNAIRFSLGLEPVAHQGGSDEDDAAGEEAEADLGPLEGMDVPESTVREVFAKVKSETDDFVVNGKLSKYCSDFLPRSAKLCIIYICDAFEQLGCAMRTGVAGQKLNKPEYLPQHERFIQLIYGMLEDDGLIQRKGSDIFRTAVPAPTDDPKKLLNDLLRDEPIHGAEHKLVDLVGPVFADCLVGKNDGIKLIFGTPEGREYASDLYSKSPIAAVWIDQAQYFIEQLVGKLPKDGKPLRILEMGAGTGGTTSKIAPLLERLGVPVVYTVTDISGSLVAAGYRRFKQYPFVEFKVLDIEAEPDKRLLESQHIILATNCVHATRNLNISLNNIRRLLRPDGVVLLLEMTKRMAWVDLVFGLIDGWWLFEDERDYVITSAAHWESVFRKVGFADVDWTAGDLPESSLQHLFIGYASGQSHVSNPQVLPSSDPPSSASGNVELLDEETARRGAMVDAAVKKYTEGFRLPTSSASGAPSSKEGKCVLVTGATGSLGGHIVANLARQPDVQTVICINRLNPEDATVRQRKSLATRGITLDDATFAKLKVIDTNTSKPLLGLSEEMYKSLTKSVTHIVHSAWPMSLTRPFKAYEPQIKVMRYLLDLACAIVEQRPATFRLGFQLISSLAVVANYPTLTGNAWVPEETTTIASVPGTGYAEAKLACETMLNQTLNQHRRRFKPMVVRVAQIAGSTSNGYWNSTEYMPFLVKSSKALGLLPQMSGTLSWYPVDHAATSLGELLLADTDPSQEQLIYHIDNPARQGWKEMMEYFAYSLNIPLEKIVPYDEWYNKMVAMGGTPEENPALQLAEYFELYFVPMSCGGLILETKRTEDRSKTLKNSKPLDRDLIMKYVEAWKVSGFL